MQVVSSKLKKRSSLPRANEGKGRALRTGIQAARGRLVAFHDVDDEYSPSDLAVMVTTVESSGAIAATGTRRHSQGWALMTRANRFGNQFFTIYFNWSQKTDFSDVCCGTKVFVRAELPLDQIREKGWAIDVESLALLAQRGRVIELPVEYNPRSIHDGKKIRWYHGVQIVRAIWRLRSRR